MSMSTYYLLKKTVLFVENYETELTLNVKFDRMRNIAASVARRANVLPFVLDLDLLQQKIAVCDHRR